MTTTRILTISNTESVVSVVIAQPNKPVERLDINLEEWAKAEARLAEQASVTAAKAPELMAFFNRQVLELDRVLSKLEFAYQVALREAEKQRSQVLLDRAPTMLRERGLVTGKNPLGSEDLRNAILAQDADYQQALDDADFAKAIKALMKGKADAFLRGFQAVRSTHGDQKYSLNLPNRNLSGDSGTAEAGKGGTPGFGRPRQ